MLGSTMTSELARDLPTSNTPFALLETAQPEVTGDLFSAGGLNVAGTPKFGAFLNSWTQTRFRIGDVTFTDPRAGGTPLLLPILPLWDRMSIVTGAMGVEEGASGLSIMLDPRRPTARWLREIEGWASSAPLVSNAPGPIPAVDHVEQWQDATVLISGPLTDRAGLVAAGSWRRLAHVAVPSLAATTDRVASGFAHVVFGATPRDEIRALGWVQGVSTPGFSDTGVHVQSTWERREPRAAWRVFGGYTERSRTVPVASTLVVDSLTSDPVSDLVESGAGSARQWILGARLAPTAAPSPTVGIDLEGAQVDIPPTTIEQVPHKCSHRTLRKPAASIQPTQSAPV